MCVRECVERERGEGEGEGEREGEREGENEKETGNDCLTPW